MTSKAAARGKPAVPAQIRDRGQAPRGQDWVYRYYDREQALLYVGLATNLAGRASTHRSTSKWWRFVATAEAFLAPLSRSGGIERSLIRYERPLFNVVHSTVSAEEIVEYCVYREAWDLVDEYLYWYDFDVRHGIREAVA